MYAARTAADAARITKAEYAAAEAARSAAYDAAYVERCKA
jgi:hypothetical protein